ncbi:monalysin family beta-barrel pore-forming toxin [Pseudomonas tructae]|uniref:Monalysin family beta-barrel pore-forming toxin n=1 Tax=Pseudomonas tructae TaxID=2518644 RepID=A0A411MEV9_9PSED|nr:monalysin family beta-barrel pore-forming toxin [Pseudomonas tructae]QBF25375.1 monalysin family beta-barrel pore-forming toxin [Pseudomonas tructae]
MEKHESYPEHRKGYPLLRGSAKIDRYLLAGAHGLRQGCWVEGETVRGDVFIGRQNWHTYSRPVFAYLEQVDIIRLEDQAEFKESVTVAQGYSRAFTQSLSVKYDISPSIDIINASAGLEMGYSQTETWTNEKSHAKEVTLKGPGVFTVYQLYMVYAHCADSAGKSMAAHFKYHKQLLRGRVLDLYYLSSVATNKTVTVKGEAAVSPLDWEDVQRIVLMEGFDPQANDDPNSNDAAFKIDFYSADINPRLRY